MRNTSRPAAVSARIVQRIRAFLVLIDPVANVSLSVTAEKAAEAVVAGDPDRVRAIDGQYSRSSKSAATWCGWRDRSVGRCDTSKQTDGPCLIVAERMDEIRRWLDDEGLGDQFHPAFGKSLVEYRKTQK